MMKLKHNFKKGMAFVLSLAMVVGLVPAMSGGANTVQAATGEGTQPSVTAFATKDQLMGDTFKPDADGNATTIGKLVFGKKSDGTTAQEWYILGKDTGVSGDNTIIFAASPIATGQKFNSNTNSKIYNYEANAGYGDNLGNIEVYPNHYGASDLRVALQGMATNTSYFTTAEQGLMNPTTVTTKDTKNKDSSGNDLTYTTTDKLYALAADVHIDRTIKAGSDNSTVIAMSSYWRNGDRLWLRSPSGDINSYALLSCPGRYVLRDYVNGDHAVQPASNLNLSSVLFASAATAASSDTAKSGTIASGTAMTLRLDGTGKNIGTVTYNTTTGDIKVVRGDTSQPVALVVQGNNGTNDWFYSKQITGTEAINVSAIESESYTPKSIDLSACKIWLETTDSTENLTYAVNATEAATSNITSVAITDIDTPAANTALDTSASCTTTGVSSTTPQITWTPNDTTAGYNTSYTASITLTADIDYEFTDSTTATVLGNSATSVTKNADGTLTVTYAFPATAKDKLTSITAPQAITVANGTAYSAMNLPATVNIATEGNTVTSAPVTWNTTTPANGSYDPAVLIEQTVTLNGTVACPDSIDANGVSLTTTITITISAAGIVTAPSITTQPGNATVKAGETATFTIAASGTDLTYQWKIDRNDGNGWVNIDGATAASYTTSTVDIICNGFKYQCVVSNSAGTDTSNTAVLTVTENTTPAPGSVDYEILDGANTSWEQNFDGSLSIRGSGAVSKFVGVKVDGNLVDVKNYTVKEGSTIVTLKADYLNILSVGNHTFEIIWTDGTASTRFTVSKSDSGSAEQKDNDGNNGKNDNTNNTPATVPEDKNNNGTSGSQTDDNQQITAPKTGDNSHTVLWISLLGVSLAGLLSMIYVRKKKENE